MTSLATVLGILPIAAGTSSRLGESRIDGYRRDRRLAMRHRTDSICYPAMYILMNWRRTAPIEDNEPDGEFPAEPDTRDS